METEDVTPKQELSEDQKVLQEFNNSLNEFIYKINNFTGSKAQLQRVFTNMMIHPMNKDEFHFSYPEEEELFNLSTTVSSTKFFLMLSGLEHSGKITFNEDVSNQPQLESKEE